MFAAEEAAAAAAAAATSARLNKGLTAAWSPYTEKSLAAVLIPPHLEAKLRTRLEAELCILRG
eukprot:374445-Pyramimonas_sp.AAC.1